MDRYMFLVTLVDRFFLFFSFLPILPRCRSTFAQDYSTYWVGVESPPVNVRKRSIDVLTSSTPISTLRTTTPPYYSPTVDYEVSILRPITFRPLITRQTCFSHPIIIAATDHRLCRERAGEVKSCPNIEIFNRYLFDTCLRFWTSLIEQTRYGAYYIGSEWRKYKLDSLAIIFLANCWLPILWRN